MKVLSMLVVVPLLAAGGCTSGGGKGGAASAAASAPLPAATDSPPPDALPLRPGTVIVTGSTLTAEVPAGYAKMGPDMPGIDDNTRAHMAAGDLFLANRQNQTLVADGRAGPAREQDAASCKTLAQAMARSLNGTLVDSEVVANATSGKACRTDVRLGPDGAPNAPLARSFVWRVNPQMQAVVMCIPFAEGTPSDSACSQFAASVKAK